MLDEIQNLRNSLNNLHPHLAAAAALIMTTKEAVFLENGFKPRRDAFNEIGVLKGRQKKAVHYRNLLWTGIRNWHTTMAKMHMEEYLEFERKFGPGSEQSGFTLNRSLSSSRTPLPANFVWVSSSVILIWGVTKVESEFVCRVPEL